MESKAAPDVTITVPAEGSGTTATPLRCQSADETPPRRTFRRVSTPENLAARYRPRRFAELVGQRHVAAVLAGAVRSGRFPQQLLLTGGSGLGKTTVARIASAAQLCESASETSGDACGECDTCRSILAQTHPDVIELDAASHGGKDEILELTGRAHTLPLLAKYKVYIIDEVHALSGAGMQAFLKLLEEPPAHVLFMLATTNPEKLSSRAGGAGTIRGRCLELELIPPGQEELAQNLLRIARAEGWRLTLPQAEQIAASANSELGVRGTVNMLARLSGHLSGGEELSDDTIAALLGTVPAGLLTHLTEAIRAGDLSDAFETLDQLRRSASEGSVRDALARWARKELGEALAGERAVAPSIPLGRLEAVLTCPPGPLNTDLLVARLARPSVAADPEILSAQLHEANRVIARLEQLTRTAEGPPVSSAPKHDHATGTTDGVEDDRPDAQAESRVGRREASDEEQPEQEQPEQEQPKQEGPEAGGTPAQDVGIAGTFDDLSDFADGPAPASQDAPEEETLAQLRVQMSQRSRTAAALWDASAVDYAGRVAVVRPPAHLRAKVEQVTAVWSDVLTQHGMALRVEV